MALEAAAFRQGLFGYAFDEWCATAAGGGGGGGAWGSGLGGLLEAEKRMGGGGDGTWDPSSCSSSLAQHLQEWKANSPSTKVGGRRKRRRAKSVKNKEEVESQRMTHIAVERNRRRQMNEYLAVLRSLMPSSFVQRGDQASIVGGAINYVKELEQLLRSLELRKRLEQRAGAAGVASAFADCFSFPQYASYSANGGATDSSSSSSSSNNDKKNHGVTGADTAFGNSGEVENRAATANIEVTVVESHASLKVLSRRRPKQLVKLVVGLQSLRLMPLHLNVTSLDQMVLYAFSLKVEDDCQHTSVDEIATAVHQMLCRIEEEETYL
uniref:BHLH domain-containing protein n=1 Tax=Musa acuminata subsp. malaccensis TaxID=214687 RepID=A0A804KXY6_MUSAM|nr:PREDICTED: transcription factor bHLH94-like isoform X2 [Musa acuminata subsp. malaccensis]